MLNSIQLQFETPLYIFDTTYYLEYIFTTYKIYMDQILSLAILIWYERFRKCDNLLSAK